MKFVKPTQEQKDFIPTPLATHEGIKTVGIVDEFVSVDYVANANDVNVVEECGIQDEMEPSTAKIIANKIGTVGNDFASVDLRVLRGE